jgi:hypothetical protein
VGGGLAALLLLALATFGSRPVEAQDPQDKMETRPGVLAQATPPAPKAPSLDETPATTAGSTIPSGPTSFDSGTPVGSYPSSGTSSVGRSASNGFHPPSLERLKAEGIDELLSHLDMIKAQKAELEKVEKEMVTVLKEKIKEQKQRMQKLGVSVEENGAVPLSSPTGSLR